MTLSPDTPRCGRTSRQTGEPCQLPAGWGTGTGEGACKHHGGASTGPKTAEGKRIVSGNGEKHAIRSDPKKYHERQPDEEKAWIFEVSEVICDRIRNVKGDIDPLDRILARRIAIKLHIVAHATDYISKEGLMQTITVTTDSGATYEKEIENDLLTSLRAYDKEIFNELKKLGVIDDPDLAHRDAARGLITILAEEMQGDRDGGD